MRIDLVITELDMGGAEQCLVRLASYLQAEGWQVRVLSMGPPPSAPRDGLAIQLDEMQIPSHFLHGRSWKDLPRVIRDAKRLIQQDPPAIAQAFLFHANVLAAWCYPTFQIPCIAGYRVAEPRRWRYPIERWASRRMASGVCVSESVAAWCREQVGIDANRLLVIPNGVTPSEWKGQGAKASLLPSQSKTLRENFSIPLDVPLMTFVGRLSHQKGIDQLVAAIPSIMEQLPQFHLVVVGDGEERSLLEELASSRHSGSTSAHASRLHVVGWSQHARLWMAMSEILLLPTRYEGMPNVLLEAMAEGLALATMDVEGVREVLGESSENQVAPGGDWEAWKRLVMVLGRSTELRKQLAIANRHRSDQLAWHHFFPRYAALYQKLAKKEQVKNQH